MQLSTKLIALLVIGFTNAQNGYQENGPGSSGYNYPSQEYNNDEESQGGEIPGEPGQDYPVYTEPPETSFNCENQQYPGYYADPEAQCQVFHICQRGGRSDAFLCPIGTVFNQETLVCDWWYNFECERAESLYGVNEQILRAMEEADARLAQDRNGGYSYEQSMLTPDAAYGVPSTNGFNGKINGNARYSNGNIHQSSGNGFNENASGYKNGNNNGHHSNGNGFHGNGNKNANSKYSNGNGYKNGGNGNGHYTNGNGGSQGNGNGHHGSTSARFSNSQSPVYGVPQQQIEEFSSGNGNGYSNGKAKLIGNGNGHNNGNGNGYQNGNSYQNGNGHNGSGNGRKNGNGTGNGYHNGNRNGNYKSNGSQNGNDNGYIRENGNGFRTGNGNGYSNGQSNGHSSRNTAAPKSVYGAPFNNNELSNGNNNGLAAYKNGFANSASSIKNGQRPSAQYGPPEVESLNFREPNAYNGNPQNTYLPPSRK